MDSVRPSERLLRRVRQAYEMGRIRRALLAMLPIALLLGLYLSWGRRPGWAFALGGLLLLVATLWLWRGLEPGRAVGPGILAGVIPLLVMHCATAFGHSCSGACVRFCLPWCIAGGLLAGLGLAFLLRNVPGQRVWWYAGGLIVLTGLLGCPHATVAQWGGLALGVLVSVLVAGRPARGAAGPEDPVA